MISAPSRSCSSLPSRSATSSTTSFSSMPSTPSVPESWPPCPASMTMRPIFKPSARTRLVSPSAVLSAAFAGSHRALRLSAAPGAQHHVGRHRTPATFPLPALARRLVTTLQSASTSARSSPPPCPAPRSPPRPRCSRRCLDRHGIRHRARGCRPRDDPRSGAVLQNPDAEQEAGCDCAGGRNRTASPPSVTAIAGSPDVCRRARLPAGRSRHRHLRNLGRQPACARPPPAPCPVNVDNQPVRIGQQKGRVLSHIAYIQHDTRHIAGTPAPPESSSGSRRP